MPAKNSVKVYVKDGHYHLYNRGVEKRKIFLDDDDYRVFLFLLKLYLSPKDSLKGSDPKPAYYSKKNLHGQIELIAYCLMPNHFHLLVKQSVKEGITDLMRCVNTSYAGYFNRKYDRVGSLFQGKFKAVLVDTDEYLLHLSRYIHLNPSGLIPDLSKYEYSSFLDYLGKRKTEWLKSEILLAYFRDGKGRRRVGLKDYFSYRAFVEDYSSDLKNILGGLTIEDD